MGRLAPEPRLRGREAEIGKLGEALDRAAAGQLAIALIEGEAGIGKSRLLAEALAAGQSRGMQIATSRAEELERARPFGVVATSVSMPPETWPAPRQCCARRASGAAAAASGNARRPAGRA